MSTLEDWDLIEIKNIRPRVQIGISPHELYKKQEVVICLTLAVDIRKAAETDSINDTLDYRTINKTVLKYAESTAFNLVEKFVEDVAKICVVVFRLPWVKVSIEKPHALRFSDSVGITITRTPKDYSQLACVHVSLGSNSNPLHNLKAAIRSLKQRSTVLKTSRVFLTPPKLDTDQQISYNMAAMLISPGGPDKLREILSEIEENLSRVRDPSNKNEPRAIDLNIALWNDVISDADDFTSLKKKKIPDPDILRLGHVVVPLADISPGLLHPVAKKTLKQIAIEVTGQNDYVDLFETVDCVL